MSIKRGDMVSHATAAEWGVGRVTETSPIRIAIQFHDGVTRKIASSHFKLLLPAEAGSFPPFPDDFPKTTALVGAKPARVSKKKIKA